MLCIALKYNRGRGTWSRANLGWVDFIIGCSTVCQVLPRHMRSRQYSQSTRQDGEDNCQPNPGPRPDAPPCTQSYPLVGTELGKRHNVGL